MKSMVTITLLCGLLAACGSDYEEITETKEKVLTLQCVNHSNGTTCYGQDIKCHQPYWHNGQMECRITYQSQRVVEE